MLCHFMFYEPLTEVYQKNLKSCSPLPIIDHITEENPIGAYVPLLFPNLGIGASESSWSIFHIIPLAPDKTKVISRTRVMPVSNWSFYKQEWRSYQYYKDKGGKYKEGTEADDPMMNGDFMAEDVFVCEQQQKSLASPLFSVGATTKKQEASVRGFQQWILRSVTA